MNYTCDYGHQSDTPVRVLPLGAHGNIILCVKHFYIEMRFRLLANETLIIDCHWIIPRWEDLEIYQDSEKIEL